MFGQIRRPRSECKIPMYCKFSLPTIPKLWHTPLSRSASALLELPGGPTEYNVLSRTFFIMDGKVLEKCAELVEHDRQTAECSSSFGHNNGFAASSYAGNSLDGVKVFLSLSPTGADQRCTKENHKILLQFNLHKFL